MLGCDVEFMAPLSQGGWSLQTAFQGREPWNEGAIVHH